MIESQFIKQNKDKWEKVEKNILGKDISPSELSKEFVQVTEDLSYAHTFYTYRTVRLYLNGLAQVLFNSVYKNKKSKFRSIDQFWVYELPAIIYNSRMAFLIAFLVFILSMSIGIISGMNDSGFAKSILGEDYIKMTIDNIDNRDPMAVYKKMNEVDMFLGITINNLRVAFMTFLMGAILAVGTIAYLIYNGIMVGCFQYFFIERELFIESFLTIWTHGSLEIPAIIIAGAAGLVMAKGLIFPGTFSRLQAFIFSAQNGLKIMLGTVPIFIIAALIESFVTRHTDLPNIWRFIFILVCFSCIFGYFVFYPYKMRNNAKALSLLTHEPRSSSKIMQEPINGIRNYGEMLASLMNFIATNSIQIFKIIGILSFIAGGIFILFVQSIPLSMDSFNSGWMLDNILETFFYMNSLTMFFFNVTSISILLYALFYFESEANSEELSKSFKISDIKKGAIPFLNIFIVIAMHHSFNFLSHESLAFFLIYILSSSFFMLATYVCFMENCSLFLAFQRCLSLLSNSWGSLFGLSAIIYILGYIIVLFTNSPIGWLYVQFISWNLLYETEISIYGFGWFLYTLSYISILFSHAIVAIIIIYLYNNMLEISEAKELRSKLYAMKI